mgnify:CR=1 FL=1
MIDLKELKLLRRIGQEALAANNEMQKFKE